MKLAETKGMQDEWINVRLKDWAIYSEGLANHPAWRKHPSSQRETRTMLTLEEIQSSKINITIAREAYEQADKRLADILETKKAFEQKAFILFNAYIALALALFGAAGVIYRDPTISLIFWPFLLAGSLLIVGAGCFVWALLDAGYGSLASDPDMWLNKGTIDGDDAVLGYMLAYIAYHHKHRITKSTTQNESKALLIRIGIYIGLVTPLALLGLLVC